MCTERANRRLDALILGAHICIFVKGKVNQCPVYICTGTKPDLGVNSDDLKMP